MTFHTVLYLSTGTLSQNGVVILLKWERSTTGKPLETEALEKEAYTESGFYLKNA